MVVNNYYYILILHSLTKILLAADQKTDGHHNILRKDVDYIVTNENCYIDGCGGLILPFISEILSPKSLTLWCNVSETINDSIDNWYKDGRLITSNDTNYEISYVDKNRSSSLVIRKSTPSDIGTFTCDTAKNYNASIKTRLRPFLLQFDEYYKNNYKSANLDVGETFSLECKPMPLFSLDVDVNWYRYDHRLVNESTEIDYGNLIPIIDDDRVKVEGNGSSKRLTIEDTEMSDRDYYICVAYNGVAAYNNTIFLRVKDMWRLVYPASIIGVELLVLCTFMLCYEKFRKKPDFDNTNIDHLKTPLSKSNKTSDASRARKRNK